MRFVAPVPREVQMALALRKGRADSSGHSDRIAMPMNVRVISGHTDKSGPCPLYPQ